MASTQAMWLIPVVLSLIAVNFTIAKFVIDNKIRRPIRVSMLAHFLIALFVIGLVIWAGLGITLAIIIFFVIVILLVATAWLLKQLDVRGINLAEQMLKAVYVSDVQISYVLYQIATKENPREILKAIERGLDMVLSIMLDILDLRNQESGTMASILYARKDGKFKVISTDGISNNLIRIMETRFSFQGKIASLAGYAAANCESFCITDLAHSDDDRVKKHWCKLENDEKIEGSIVCYVLERGVGQNQKSAPLAVINILTPQKKDLKCKSVLDVIKQFSHRIEALVYCYEIFERVENTGNSA
jgi:hypothetical protein